MRAFKISHLSQGFVAMVGGLALVLGAYMLHELEGITRAVQERERQAARDEIRAAMSDLNAQVLAMGERLANWDETRQQIVHDVYYVLWRDERVPDTGVLGADVEAVALYDAEGRILMSPPEHALMPERVAGIQGPSFVVIAGEDAAAGHAQVFHFRPVYIDAAAETPLGYVGLRLDLLSALEHTRRFRFADVNAIHLGEGRTEVAALQDLADRLELESRPNPLLDLVREVFKRELLHLLIFVVAVLSLASFLLHRFMVRPLLAIAREIDDSQGEPQAFANEGPMPVQELEQVRRSVGNYQSRLAELNRTLERSSRDFYEQSRRDSLTGAFNRRALEEDWTASEAKSAEAPCVLILFDCDHFKAINDTYGHAVGDAVIKAVAASLQECLRAGDRLYRLGGDELVTYLRGADARVAWAVAERCLEQVAQHDFKQYGLPEPVSISIGLAVADPALPDCSLSTMQKHADLAMYAAKRPGGQRIVCYDDKMAEAASLVASHCINAVFEAIASPSLFELHYQPVVQLPERRYDYFEALARIRSDGRLFTPADIFPIVQARRLDAELDLAIVQAVAIDLQRVVLEPGQGVSINVSAAGIVHAKVVSALLELRRREHGRTLVVEITETALITQMETASEHLRQLRQAGILVALDDFGSGYSSLRYLASMPVDIVKFDLSMIRLLEHPSAQHRGITQGIAAMVRSAGYHVVAEGVETEAMLSRVIESGFDHAQGFLFDAPRRPRRIEAQRAGG